MTGTRTHAQPLNGTGYPNHAPGNIANSDVGTYDNMLPGAPPDSSADDIDSQLEEVIDAWRGLPEAVHAGILAMAQARPSDHG